MATASIIVTQHESPDHPAKSNVHIYIVQSAKNTLTPKLYERLSETRLNELIGIGLDVSIQRPKE